MNPAQTIAQTLDRHLTQRTEVVVFGAAALLLDKAFAVRMPGRKTNDIDIIIPSHREMQIEADRNFWKALEATNHELKRQGLYITHIFAERQVALTPEWKQHTVALPQDGLANLRLQRPRVLDLAVSKMGRGDAQDVDDVRNMLRLHREITGVTISAAQVTDAARRAHVPDDYREIFPRACERIVAAVREMEIVPPPTPHLRGPRQDPGYRIGF